MVNESHQLAIPLRKLKEYKTENFEIQESKAIKSSVSSAEIATVLSERIGFSLQERR